MTPDERTAIADHPTLLYDGVCALCNGVVRFVLRHDRAGVFRFAALDSDAARELMDGAAATQDGVALVLQPLTAAQRILYRSDAVAEALRLLGWRRRAALLAAVPRPLRESGYGIVARLRYRLFGRYAVCPLPAAEHRKRFVGLR
ncbi:MAG: DCC1-like thiol-disulfide oxidoreductase family protein [Edaphobacter sp.]|uniref:thiol-disulfide oxidoreductase DCC family protein n=1 Tax=Edaphobacter sp. TaxID=1934404 RepID=UPI0023A057C7|nr:DCC1-like thiol-disulfide oxidoreductase family protein [Edaphobacter sp.]MDE1176939.1 DCC1-like thiol-disulfide oxidoreductase family protein [Edaphobacter sp.]